MGFSSDSQAERRDGIQSKKYYATRSEKNLYVRTVFTVVGYVSCRWVRTLNVYLHRYRSYTTSEFIRIHTFHIIRITR
jgi:hypothetical protein